MNERRSTTDGSHGGNSPTGHVFEAGEQPVAEAVVEATSTVTGRDPLDMEPLFDVVDPDALETLVAGPAGSAGVSVSFQFEGRQITVQRGGRIHIADG
ncbi:HalOD1 output domain-containing protein [Haloglomus litoreum]|uniref:HalOD1 output domain-containing protein n=1 Tax=Haloglomus litoreum TaxID=3034026 RepID=UPI0023E878E2|nr:HalOD1 output domain-containing protein [Haloglomus sp. DT116]